MDQKTCRKNKMSRCNILNRYSSKEIYSCIQCNPTAISTKTKGRKAEDVKDCFLSTPGYNNFTIEALHYTTDVDRKIIRNYADVLAKTEKIWSQNSPAFEKEPFSFSSEYTFVKPNALEKELDHGRGFKTIPLKKTDIEGHSAFWKNLNSSPECVGRYTAENLITEINSLVLEIQPEKDKISTDLSGSSSKDKDSQFSGEPVSTEKFDYLDELLDDDSAYGSHESLPRSSPEPSDFETGLNSSAHSEIFEDSDDPTKSDSETESNSNVFKDIISNKFYSKLHLDQDSECICGDSDCDTHETGEFQEFLKGLASTKPRLVVHKDEKCSICKSDIVNKFSLTNRFGLLLNCEHPFCYSCIFSVCYRKKNSVSIFKVRCPVCSAWSPGVVSSPRFIKSKIKKVNLFRDLKLAYIERLIFKLYLGGMLPKVLKL